MLGPGGGAGHLVADAHGAGGIFIPVASVAWGGYVALRSRSEPGYPAELGLTRRELGPAFRDASLVALAGTAVMAAIGAERGTLRLDGDVVPLLLLYPAWGVVQQTLVQGMVARNLDATHGWMAALYLRHRNTWPLGLYHGVLGALFYVWVLDRNPWTELTR